MSLKSGINSTTVTDHNSSNAKKTKRRRERLSKGEEQTVYSKGYYHYQRDTTCHARETREQVFKKGQQISIKETTEASHVVAEKHGHLWGRQDCSEYRTWNESRMPSTCEC